MEDNIEVAIRVRPLLEKEVNEELPIHWKINDQDILQVDDQGKPSQAFRFDHIFGAEKTNHEIFEAVVQPMVRSGMAGYNATIFAYGQTASGKTYTMLGSENDLGIIPLTIEDIFETINNNLERKFLLRLSYIEIYNDTLNDLLDVTPKTVTMREDSSGTIHLNIEEKIIHNALQAHAILKEGDKVRRYGATNANQRSSRSHTIFRIIIESTPLNDDPDTDLPVQVSHLNLVDLAGSERVSQTKAAGVRLREGGQINKSLHLLSRVIRELSKGRRFTSFRDSKLTRILKESLGGNAKTLIIGAITPTSIEDSHSTLNFAYEAKKIKNKPSINEVLDSKTLTKQYMQKEKELHKQLAEMAKDKKELEEKHIRTVGELTDQLYYFRQQFVIGSNTTPVKEEVKRRHTMCSSTVQKTAKHFKFASNCATVQRNTKMRKTSRYPPENIPGTSSVLHENVPGTFTSLQENVPTMATTNCNQRFEQIEKIYKRLRNFIAADNSEFQNKEERKSIIVEGVQKIYDGFCNLQTKVEELESQTCISSDQAACSNDDHQNVLLDSGRTTSVDGFENNINIGNETWSTCIPSESITPIIPVQADQLNDLKSRELEEKELLNKKINNLNLQLRLAQRTNTALELKLEETSKMLEKTEDELLSVNEQLDHEENEKNKLQQAVPDMMSKIACKINELKDDYGVLQLKNVFDNIIKSNENFNQYLDLTKEVSPIKLLESEDTKLVHQQESSEEQQDPVTENEFLSVQSEPSALENEPQKFVSVIDSLHDLKILLCSDDNAVSLSEEQEKILATIQTRLNDENDKQNSFKQRCEELQSEMQELELLVNNQYKANLEKEQEISKMDKRIVQKDKHIVYLKSKISRINDVIELTDIYQNCKNSFENQLREEKEAYMALIKENEKLIYKMADLEDSKTELTNHLSAIEASIGDKTKAINKLTDEKQQLKMKLAETEQLNENLVAKDNKLHDKLTEQEQLNAKLSEENSILQDKLVQQVEFNAELTKKKLLLEDDINKQTPTKLKLIEENNVLQVILTQSAEEKQILENTNAKLTKELNILQNKLTEQEQLVLKFSDEKYLLEGKITKQNEKIRLLETSIFEQNEGLREQIKILETKFALQVAKTAEEMQMLQDRVTRGKDKYAKLSTDLTNENDELHNKLVQQQQLNNELVKQRRLLEDQVDKYLMQEKEMIELTEENGVLQKKLIHQEKLIADLNKYKYSLKADITKQKSTNTKLAEENKILQENLTQVLQDTVTRYEDKCAKLNAELTNEKDILHNKLAQQQQLNIELSSKNNLLEDRIAKYLKQVRSAEIKLAEEHNIFQIKLAEQKQLNAELAKEKDVLKQNVDKQHRSNIDLAAIISDYDDLLKDKIFVSIKPQKKAEQEQKLAEENKILQDKNTKQKKVIDDLRKQVTLYLKQSAELASLSEKFKTPTATAEGYTENVNELVNTEDPNDMASSSDYKHEWELHIKQLYDIITSKNEEIQHLDKEIIGAVEYLEDCREIVKIQFTQISKLSQLKFITDVKKRRSITQDLSRNLNEDGKALLCSSCKITDLMVLNNALLREISRKNMEIAKLEQKIRNLYLYCGAEGLENLNGEYEILKIKYKQVKEVAVMRRQELKKLMAYGVDRETQT